VDAGSRATPMFAASLRFWFSEKSIKIAGAMQDTHDP
jgi:hypothetical protein